MAEAAHAAGNFDAVARTALRDALASLAEVVGVVKAEGAKKGVEILLKKAETEQDLLKKVLADIARAARATEKRTQREAAKAERRKHDPAPATKVRKTPPRQHVAAPRPAVMNVPVRRTPAATIPRPVPMPAARPPKPVYAAPVVTIRVAHKPAAAMPRPAPLPVPRAPHTPAAAMARPTTQQQPIARALVAKPVVFETTASPRSVVAVDLPIRGEWDAADAIAAVDAEQDSRGEIAQPLDEDLAQVLWILSEYEQEANPSLTMQASCLLAVTRILAQEFLFAETPETIMEILEEDRGMSMSGFTGEMAEALGQALAVFFGADESPPASPPPPVPPPPPFAAGASRTCDWSFADVLAAVDTEQARRGEDVTSFDLPLGLALEAMCGLEQHASPSTPMADSKVLAVTRILGREFIDELELVEGFLAEEDRGTDMGGFTISMGNALAQAVAVSRGR